MRHIFLPHAHAFDSSVLTFSPKFWLFIVITGIGAGLGADGLMALLTTVQHVSYNYEQGYFQTAVAQVSAWHRLAVLIAAGLLATFMVWLLRKLSHGANSDIVHAIWFQSGRVSFWHTIVQAMLSMTIVGMGASLGREGAPKSRCLTSPPTLCRFIRSIWESCSGPFSSDHWLGSCPFYLCGSLFGWMPINHSPDGPCGHHYPCLPCLAFSPFPIHSFWGTVAFNDLITPSLNIVPVSASYSLLVYWMTADNAPQNLYVVDHSGKLVGVISSENLWTAGLLTRTMGIAAASDLKMPVTAIRSDQSRKEVLNLLQQTFFSQLPVVDGITMQYMGIIKQNCDCSA